MKKIRFGNDIPIEWSINRNDKPEDFTGKTLRLTMIGTSGTTEVTDYTIEDNVLRWMFWGKDQHKPSTYHFCLVENGGEEGMFTIDTCDVLRLVGRSCAADDCDGPFTMQVTSNIDDKGVTCSSVITVPSNGLSAYEIAVLHGFKGTEEEWLDSLRQPAEDAAEEAQKTIQALVEAGNKATEAANAAAAAADKAVQAVTELGNRLSVAETAREEAESGRVQAELLRVQAEEARVAAESLRDSAERQRTAAEELRVRAEQLRVAAEQARAAARADAEAARVKAETARVGSETARVKAEEARVTAETSRVQPCNRVRPVHGHSLGGGRRGQLRVHLRGDNLRRRSGA